MIVAAPVHELQVRVVNVQLNARVMRGSGRGRCRWSENVGRFNLACLYDRGSNDWSAFGEPLSVAARVRGLRLWERIDQFAPTTVAHSR
jgi:hypothetical protein